MDKDQFLRALGNYIVIVQMRSCAEITIKSNKGPHRHSKTLFYQSSRVGFVREGHPIMSLGDLFSDMEKRKVMGEFKFWTYVGSQVPERSDLYRPGFNPLVILPEEGLLVPVTWKGPRQPINEKRTAYLFSEEDVG